MRQGLLAALSHRGNRLDGVRLVLASMVLVAHSWPLSGHGRTPSLYGEDFGTVAVCGFFAISGYLITGSRMSLSLPRFAWHRFLRIYPGYWAVLLLTAFVFSRGLAHVAHEHWSYSAAIAHLKANWTTRIHDFALQGTLLHTAYTPGGASAWNGSSWTLYYEIMCYVIVGLLFTLPWARRTPWVAGAALLVASWVMLQPSLTTTSMDVWAMSRLGAPFAAGALMRVLGDRIPVSGRWAAVSGVLSVVAAGTGHLFPYAVLPFTYFVLWLGSGRSRSGRRADPSYGIYIYAFPVQEMLGDLGIGTSNVLLFLLLSAACVTPLAFASWHLVERPCMKARNWSPSGTALRLWAQVRARAGRYRPEERGYPDAKAEEA